MSIDLRLTNLEAAVRRFDLTGTLSVSPDASTTTATSSTTTNPVIPHFLGSSVTVQTLTDDPVEWTTFDASTFLPKGSLFAIVETEWAMQSPNSDDKDAYIKFRKQDGAIELIGSRGRAAGNSDNCAGANQLIIPITTTRTFDFTITETTGGKGFDNEATIRLIGYYK